MQCVDQRRMPPGGEYRSGRRPSAPSIGHVTSPNPSTPTTPPGMTVNPVQGLLLALVFVFEVLGLVAVAWWSVSLGGVWGVVLAVVAVSVMAALWGRFAAPRAASRLEGAPLAVFMLAWFSVGGVCLAALGHPWRIVKRLAHQNIFFGRNTILQQPVNQNHIFAR